MRDFGEVRVAGRSPEKAEALADELREQGLPCPGRGIHGRRHARGRRRLRDDARARAGRAARVDRPGTHVTSVGYDPGGREVDDATVVDALVVVESRATALAPVPAARAT